MPSPPNRGLEEIWKAKQVVPTAFTFIDLFAGIGGLRLGFEAINGKCVFTSEWDKYCNITYRANFPSDDHEIAGDVRPFGENPERIPAFDVLLAGFPCQPFSLAGKRRGQSDDRYLWPEMLRIIGESGAEWVLGENVPGINDLALDQILSDLESLGYSAWPFEIPAAAVGSDQLRFRVWILAHHNGKRGKGSGPQTVGGQQRLSRRENVRGTSDIVQRPDIHTPKLCGRSNGLSERLDALGNAIVPQIAFRFFKWMLENSEARMANEKS